MFWLTDLIGFGAARHSYQAQGVDYDGSSAYLARGGALTGVLDSPQGILSAWLRIDGGNGAQRDLLFNSGGHVAVRLGTDNKFLLNLFDAAGTSQLSFKSGNAYLAGAPWLHLLAAWDTNFSAGNKVSHLYINGASDKAVTSDSSAAFSVNYVTADTRVAGQGAASANWDGGIAELYFAPGQYLDLSVAGNRAKFIDPTTARPIGLGANGSAPTGTAPAVYLPYPASAAHLNAGNGGNFTASGTIVAASTNP